MNSNVEQGLGSSIPPHKHLSWWEDDTLKNKAKLVIGIEEEEIFAVHQKKKNPLLMFRKM